MECPSRNETNTLIADRVESYGSVSTIGTGCVGFRSSAPRKNSTTNSITSPDPKEVSTEFWAIPSTKLGLALILASRSPRTSRQVLNPSRRTRRGRPHRSPLSLTGRAGTSEAAAAIDDDAAKPSLFAQAARSRPMPPSSNNIFALLPPPGNLTASIPVIIFFMKCFHDIRFSPRAGAILRFAVPRSSGQFAPPIRSRPITGRVAASVDESTGRNRVVIQVGADTLAVNTLRASATDQQPRYRLATDALGETLTDAAIELWPESRARDQGSADQTAVVFSSGFTLAAFDREVVLFDLGRCATAGDAAVWLPGR